MNDVEIFNCKLKNFDKSPGVGMSAARLAEALTKEISHGALNINAGDFEIISLQINLIGEKTYNRNLQNECSRYNRFLDNKFFMEVLQPQLLQEEEDNQQPPISEDPYKKTFQMIENLMRLYVETDVLRQGELLAIRDDNESLDSVQDKDCTFRIKLSRSHAPRLNDYRVYLEDKTKPPVYIHVQPTQTQKKPQSKSQEKAVQDRPTYNLCGFEVGGITSEKDSANFFSYFSVGRFASMLEIETSLVQNRGAFEIYLRIQASLNIKMVFSLQHIHYVCEDSDHSIYLKLITPPIYSACLNSPRKYYKNKHAGSYSRIDNFIFNQLARLKQITEIQRLVLVNNMAVKFKFENASHKSTFLDKLNALNLRQHLKVRFYDKIPLDVCFERLRSANISFELKLDLLSLISHNRLSKAQTISEAVKFVIDEAANTDVLQDAIAQAFKRMSNCNTYADEGKINEINLKLLREEYGYVLQNRVKIPRDVFKLSFIRRIVLTPSGIAYHLRQPEKTSGIIRLFLDRIDCFLRVNFEDENQDTILNIPFVTKHLFLNIVYPYFEVFGRKYEIFTWSASQMRSASCWFVTGEPRSYWIRRVGDFSSLKPWEVSKNAARLGQNLSSSITVKLVPQGGMLRVKISEDLVDQNLKLYTDGIGQISSDLMVQVRDTLKLNVSILQIRFEGAKGVLVENQKLDCSTIELRKSMVKYGPVKGVYQNSLEVLDYNKYRGGYLNRQIIMLLLTLNIPNEVFSQLQNRYLQIIEHVSIKNASIYNYFNADYNTDIYGFPSITTILRELINHGQGEDNNFFVRGIMSRLKERGLFILRTKTNILVEKAARVIGILDEFGILEANEAYCCISPEIDTFIRVEGKMIVTRNPCLHPGDIQILTAVPPKVIIERWGSNPLEKFVNCVIFPQKGESVPPKIAGGDLDGDLYFVSWEPRLIPSEPHPAMVYDLEKQPKHNESLQQQQASLDSLFDKRQMVEFLFSYLNSDVLGKIDNSHLAIADRSAKKALDEKCLELAKLHSEAVDFVKHGQPVSVDKSLFAKEWPDYMEKESEVSYVSQTVIGQLYREVVALSEKEENFFLKFQGYASSSLPPLQAEFFLNFNDQSQNSDIEALYPQQVVHESLRCLLHIFRGLQGMLEIFQIRNEYEIYSGTFSGLTKGDDLYYKRKLNAELNHKRIINYLMAIQIEANGMISQKNRRACVSLIYLLMHYSPEVHQFYDPNDPVRNYVLQTMQEVKKSHLFKSLTDFIPWYRGCAWFFFWKDILEIKGNVQEQCDI